MGAILTWIAEHARQLVAWTIFIAAISALIVAVSSSGAEQTISDGLRDARTFFLQAVRSSTTMVDLVDDAVNKSIDHDEAGWVKLIYYLLYLRGFRDIINLLVTNFRTLIVAILAAWAVVWRIFAAVFIYSRGVALARWMSNGEIVHPAS